MIINLWEHNGWGDSVSFFNYTEGTIVGWLTPRPNVGDEVRSKMQSGKIGRFKITIIDLKKDPPDMFFAHVEPIGYLQEKKK